MKLEILSQIIGFWYYDSARNFFKNYIQKVSWHHCFPKFVLYSPTWPMNACWDKEAIESMTEDHYSKRNNGVLVNISRFCPDTNSIHTCSPEAHDAILAHCSVLKYFSFGCTQVLTSPSCRWYLQGGCVLSRVPASLRQPLLQ